MYCTTEQLNQSCQIILSSMDRQKQSNMIAIYSYLLDSSKNESDESIANALSLLAKICSCQLDISCKDIFKPFIQLADGQRSFTPIDLTQVEIDYLVTAADKITIPILQARITDILWLYTKPKNPKYLRMAMESYLSISICNEFFQPEIYDFWYRAAFLAKATNHQNYTNEIKSKLLCEIETPSTTWDFHKLRIIRIIVENKLDTNILEFLADTLIKEQEKFKPQDDFNIVEQYLNMAENLFKKAKLEDKLIYAIYLRAKAIEEHADFRVTDSNMAANYFYKMALQIYRNIPSKYRNQYQAEQSLSRVESKITKSGKIMMSEMKSLEIKMNISSLQEHSIKHVQGKSSLFETLLYFSSVFVTDSYQKQLEKSQDIIRQSVLSHIMPYITISSEGRKVDEIPFLNEDNSDEVIFKTAIKNFSMKVQLAVNGCIIPALDKIQEDWTISKEFLIQLCCSSSIVPEKREHLIGKALYLGFEGDFSTSIHLLAPQVENIVRQLLKKEGVSTTTTDLQGIENEIGLSSLLDKEKSKEILGDDLWFELHVVFTSSLSANLRNQIAHGLLDDETSNSIYSVYAWWLIFKWIIRSIGEK